MNIPVLRNDLRLYPWEPAPRTGLKLWALHDPIRNKFFLIPEDAVEILKRLDLGSIPEIVKTINEETTRRVDAGDVEATAAFLQQNQLIKILDEDPAGLVRSLQTKSRQSLFSKLVHKYFFFRVPLLKPDLFLENSLFLVRPLFTRWFLLVTLLIGIIGIILTIRDWHAFEAQLQNLWSFLGLIQIALTLIFVKLVHELAHAYTAKRTGVRVPIMGIAFLFMFPFPYTDTTESWKLYGHKKRLEISAAGVVSELFLASWATLLWKVVAPGPLQDTLFIIATATWVSSLAINLMPFMRFDGYFVLMDYLQVPNLHQRAGALGRWKLRDLLFGLRDPIPEHHPAGLTSFLISFAFATWAYRLFVFIAIALLLFFLLPQPFGLILFVVEVYFLILGPIMREVSIWYERRHAIRRTRRSRLTLSLSVLILFLAALPIERRHAVPGLYLPFWEEVLYTQENGYVTDLHMVRGHVFEEGELLLSLRSATLESELRRAQLVADRLSHLAVTSESLEDPLARSSGADQGWHAAVRRVEALEDRMSNLQIHSSASGRVSDISSGLRPGVYVARNTPIAVVEVGVRDEIVLFVSEEWRRALTVGQVVTFFANGTPEVTQHAIVEFLADNPSRDLPHPELSTVTGGPMRSFSDSGQLLFDTPLFAVRLRTEESLATQQRQLVTVFLAGDRSSFLKRSYERIVFVLRQEFGG